MRSLLLAASLVTVVPTVAAAADPPRAAATSEPKKKITIDVMDADIRNVVRLIADVSGKNFVLDDEVQGKVTIKLKNVPWDQALDVILAAKDLGRVGKGNIIRVAPLAELQDEEMARLKQFEERQLKGPLKTRVIVVNYARAEELLPQVQALLSPRGSATFDARTNTIIVRDVAGSAALSQ